MFVALKPLTESNRNGPPIEHAPGDVLERWGDWPYRVRVALLHAEMAEERPDFAALPVAPDADITPQDALELSAAPPSEVVCHCGRTFGSTSALKRHVTRSHS